MVMKGYFPTALIFKTATPSSPSNDFTTAVAMTTFASEGVYFIEISSFYLPLITPNHLY
jgi:hypothetical protein